MTRRLRSRRLRKDAFERAVASVSSTSKQLRAELVTSAPPKNREAEAAKKRARWLERKAV